MATVRMTVLRFQERALARLSTLVIHRCDDPVPLTETNASGVRPLAPCIEAAVSRGALLARVFRGALSHVDLGAEAA